MSTNIAMPGTRIPRVVPMTNEQYRVHRRLGAAEKRLIQAYYYSPEDSQKIARLESTVARLTTAWRKADPSFGRLTMGQSR